MRVRGTICTTSEPVYRCDNCGVDQRLPKEVVKPSEEPKPTLEEPEEKTKTTKKTRRKKKYEDEPPED